MTYRGYTLLAIFLASALVLALSGDVNSVVGNLAIGLMGGAVILGVERMPSWRLLALATICTFRCRQRLVRVSVSYLYRVRVGDRYLLIRSERWPATHAPIGGVYKRLPGSEAHLKRLSVLDDDLHPIDERSKWDLRVRVPGWRVVNFLSWFNREENRELSPWREFYEEMVKPGHVPPERFRYLFYRRLGRRWTFPRWSEERDRFEMFVADIIEPVFDEEQEAAIASIAGGADLRWVTEEEIRARGVVANQTPIPNISDRAIWTI